MNLRDLDYLIALSEVGHFSRAAAVCQVSQPTLSAQIRKLEDELGTELIERGSRPILLTAVGEEVVAHAKTIQREVQEISETARTGADPAQGRVTLGVFPTLGPYLLPHAVPQVSEAFPDLELRLVEEKTERILEELRRGRLDAGILALPVAEDGLVVRPLFHEEFVLAVPSSDPLAQTTDAVNTEVLTGERVLLLEDGHCLRDQALSVCRLAGASERDFRATSLETLRQMVASGSGVTLLPRLSVSPPVPPNDMLTVLEFTDPKPGRSIGLVWRQSSAMRKFLPRLAEALGKVPAVNAIR